MTGFPPRGNSIKEKVLSSITDKIQYLELMPGERIDENTIEKEIGASRTPRREAMMLLEVEGLVNIYPQKGTFVSLIDLNLIREIIYLRFSVENRVFSDLALSNLPVSSDVEKYLLIQELAVKNNDFIEFIKNDYLFHKELFRLGGHLEVWNMIEGKLIHCTRFRILGWKTFHDEFELTLEEHKKLIEYIKSGNIDELSQTLTHHHDYELKRYADKLVEKFPDFFTSNTLE